MTREEAEIEFAFAACEQQLARFGTSIEGAADMVAVIARPNGGPGTIISNLIDIDATIAKLEFALEKARSAKRQIDAGLVHTGPKPPTAH